MAFTKYSLLSADKVDTGEAHPRGELSLGGDAS